MSATKIIITGGPGSGKTTLLEALRRKGYSCYEEMARKVIKEQVERGTDHVPWGDMGAFSDHVYHKMIDLKAELPKEGLCFLDRGMPDILAYLRISGLEIPPHYFESIREYEYHPTVFLAPAWADIYANDLERKEDFYEAHQLSIQLRDVYKALGFEILDLPMAGIDERLAFVESHLAEQQLMIA